ncbi:sugar nucleotide-binding protein [Phenylobacterium sp.]|uniref:SDR family oxidoreductase n=1 Tax=Phenylobacterium sp. TaxID=1871053 RepID=UPI0028977F8A|nr:sugar nucleotide-binding protein [Phenylobacterium sp.]
MITGATGLIGGAAHAVAAGDGPMLMRLSRSGAQSSMAHDLSDTASLPPLLDALAPDRIIHLAAISKPDRVEREQDSARRVNVAATATIAEWCRTRGRTLLFTSTDQVFDGTKGAPYLEDDAPAPTTAYGRMKLQAEAAVLAAGGGVARLGWVLNDQPGGRPDFFHIALERLARGEHVTAVDDERRTTITASAAARALLSLAGDGFAGLIHLAGERDTTPFQLIANAARARGLDTARLQPISRRTLSPPGRPGDVRLRSALDQVRRPAMAIA